MFPIHATILMADGTDKAIDHVNLDDEILLADGCKAIVSIIATQYYDGVVMLVHYEDDGHILATPGQLLVTDRGNIEIRNIVPGDKLLTYNYHDETLVFRDVETSAHISYRGEVMGFHFKGDGGAYCVSGVVVVEDTPIVP